MKHRICTRYCLWKVREKKWKSGCMTKNFSGFLVRVSDCSLIWRILIKSMLIKKFESNLLPIFHGEKFALIIFIIFFAF